MTFVSFAIFGWLQPHARYAYRAVIFAVETVEVFYLAEEGVFMQAGSRTFILDRLSRADGTFERMFLFDDRGVDGFETVDRPERQNWFPTSAASGPFFTSNRAIAWPCPNGRTSPPREPAASSVVGEFNDADMPLGQLNRKLNRPRGERRARTHAP